MLQSVFISFLTFLILLVLWILGKTVTLKSVQPLPLDIPPSIIGASIGFEKRLSRAIGFRTISEDNGLKNAAEFEKLIQFLENNYPKVFETALVKNFSDFSRLIVVKGNRTDLKPILLTAHLDVVPIDEKDLPAWKYLRPARPLQIVRLIHLLKDCGHNPVQN